MSFTVIIKRLGLAVLCIICGYACFKKKKVIRTVSNIRTMVSDDELKSRMDRIIEWVKTCDTKASIMLTLVCLVLSFIFTSDFFIVGFSKIIQSLRVYSDSDGGCDIKDISISGFFSIAFIIGYLYFTFGSIYRLVMVLYSKISESQIEEGLKKSIYKIANFIFRYKPSPKATSDAYMNSLIHFNNIAKMDDFNTFKSAMESSADNENEDLLSQIYINANRCKEKFEDYNAAICWMLCSLPFLLLLLLSLSVFMTYRG